MSIIKAVLALPPKRQFAVLISAVASIAALFLLASITLTPKMDLLYSGLEPAAAGEVIAKLETLDVEYEVKGSAIYADKSRRDSLRLELARDGLPRQSVVGYELFDDLNSFAMTSDMFDTAYWRAKEGELARTLLAIPSIRTARVHLGTEKSKGFSTGPTARTASVTVASSGGLSPAQAKAIQYMTALAVAGLNASDVAVIDTVGGIIAGPGIENKLMTGGVNEVEHAAQIKQSLIQMLEARVGRGNARVSVSLEFEREHSKTTERRFDPDSRVVKSQTTNETTDSSTGTNTAVTVASNLPEGEAGGGSNNAEREESSETVTYEISEIVTNKETLPGSIKRMTVAVLLNDIIERDADGIITHSERSPEEIEALTSLVSSAAGLAETRGDVLTVQSLPFDTPPLIDALKRPSVLETFLNQYLWSTVQALILAVVVLILSLFVIRPLLSQKPNEAAGLLTNGANSVQALQPISLPRVENNTALSLPLIEGPNSNNAVDITNSRNPIDVLKSAVTDQSQDAANLLATWLEQEAKAS